MNRYLRVYFVPGVLVLAIAISFLFFVKNRVQELSRNIKIVNATILAERESMHMLRAEYSYFTTPRRLKKLCDKNLNLESPNNDHILDASKIGAFIAPFLTSEKSASEVEN